MNKNILGLQKQAKKYLEQKQVSKAITIYEHCIKTNPQEVTNYWYLGLAHLLQGDEQTAEAVWMSIFLELDEDELEHCTSELVKILAEEGELQWQSRNLLLAKKIYKQIETIAPENTDGYQTLAYIYEQLDDHEQAEIIFRKIIATQPKNFQIYIDFANFLLRQYQIEATIEVLQTALNYFPDEPNIYFNLMLVWRNFGNAKKAISIAERGLKLSPNYLPFQLENARILPILYESQEEIDYYRQRFIKALDRAINNTSINSDEDKKNALKALSINTNFYLQYQGKNDLIIQDKYGKFIHKLMSICYPHWTKKLSRSSPRKSAKIKVGLGSSHLRNHNGANWALGWVKYLNRKEFIVNCYYLENITDNITEQFKKYSDNFYTYPDNLEKISQQIIEDEIDVLIYTDIGMKPQITKMAALRLAPVQCVTLGHPITSGLPTIDYYISRQLMEPNNAQEHYTEKLILLPNLGICVPKPTFPPQPKNRSYFNLNQDAIVYLSCQSLFKYLPQYDYIFPIIVQQVPQAKFVFIEFPISSFVNQQFKKRLKKAFANYALNIEDYCAILPRLDEEEYMSLNLVSDIFLDTFTWSGDNTTRMAIACNLPVVTCAGEFMRGRHSYGILKMLGVEDTIAENEAEYIDIAVKLGNNCQWRQTIGDKIKANQDKIFNDLECIKGLEKFFRNVVRKPQSN
jgi:predicted O-linked N-acetylglucosamine transferase (SPINDLY family)